MENHRLEILVTNDDGVSANGLKTLTEVAKRFGKVTVVAPDGARSGMSKAITVNVPLRIKKVHDAGDIVIYKCSGTPVDCVKLAISEIMNKKPDLVLSGINHGANSSISVLYSGTMGAVKEGCIHEIPSIGFSLCNYAANADFAPSQFFIFRIIRETIQHGLPENVCLNVNIPDGAPLGVKVCRQARGKWVEEFEKRTDPAGKSYYWLTGYYQNFEPEAEDTDEAALKNGFVAVTPVSIDRTSHENLERINAWNFHGIRKEEI